MMETVVAELRDLEDTGIDVGNDHLNVPWSLFWVTIWGAMELVASQKTFLH